MNLKKEILEVLEEVWINGYVKGKGGGEKRLDENLEPYDYPPRPDGRQYMNGKIEKIIRLIERATYEPEKRSKHERL